MPSIVAGSAGQHYACKCLNVRIVTAAPTAAPPESIHDPAYAQVYVGDEGIVVVSNPFLRLGKEVFDVDDGFVGF